MSTELPDIKVKAKFICNLCDCVSVGNKGDMLVQKMFQQFTHSNCYVGRNANQKSTVGTIQIKGDGKKNQFVVNMFSQFYPGAPKYPNDNINKRLEWFKNCLDKLLELPNIETIAFPDDFGYYDDSNDHADRYRVALDDFKKKYYLKQNQKEIEILTYQGDKYYLNTTHLTKAPKIDSPISVLKTNVSDTPAMSTRVRLASLKQLAYIGPLVVKSKPSETKTIDDTKINKVASGSGLKKNMLADDEDEPVEVKVVKGSGLKGNMLFDDEDDAELESKTKDMTPNKMKIVPKTTVVAPVATPKLKIAMKASSTPVTEIKASSVPVTEIKAEEKKTVIKMKIPSAAPKYSKNPDWVSISELVNQLDSKWDYIFKDPIMMAIINKLDVAFEKELENFGDVMEILPKPADIFNALKYCLVDPKAVIIGQDPYFANLNEAMGLSFSVPDGVSKPPTLLNIFKELADDIVDFKIPNSGNLTSWANQGVILWNSALTVRYKQKESHLKYWEDFTNQFLKSLSSKHKLVVMLWGGFAKKKKSSVMNQSKHLILEATHPSPLGANNGGWFGCKHFSKANKFLIDNQITPIKW